MGKIHEVKTLPDFSWLEWERAKPILMNTEMVRAIFEDRKTATRRVIKPAALGMTYEDGSPATNPPYQPGDILYVRETWAKLFYVDPDGYTHYDQEVYYYAADGIPDITMVDGDGFELDDQRIRWRPSIHMPKEAARLFLRVTDVRVERLRDITEEQAKAEGARRARCSEPSDCGEFSIVYDSQGTHIGGFVVLWDSTIKPADLDLYGWEANPWVWVIEFERVSKEEV